MTTIAALRRELTATKASFALATDQARGEVARLRAQAEQLDVSLSTFLLAPPLTWTSMPSALAGYGGNLGHVHHADLTGYTQVRLRAVKLGTGGDTGAKLYLRYSDTFSTTPADWDQLGDVEEIALDIAGATNTVLTSGWQLLTVDAQREVFIALLGDGGDGAISPVFGNIWAEFKGSIVDEDVRPFRVPTASVEASRVGPGGGAIGSYSLNDDGTAEKAELGIVTALGPWVDDPADAPLYECRATLVTGDTPSTGTLDTWQDLATTRSWSLHQVGVGSLACQLTLELRLAGADTLASATITITADYDTGA